MLTFLVVWTPPTRLPRRTRPNGSGRCRKGHFPLSPFPSITSALFSATAHSQLLCNLSFAHSFHRNGGVGALATRFPDCCKLSPLATSKFRTLFHFTYPVSSLFATLTKTAGVVGDLPILERPPSPSSLTSLHTRSATVVSMRLKKISPPTRTKATAIDEATRIRLGGRPCPVMAQRKPSITPAIGLRP